MYPVFRKLTLNPGMSKVSYILSIPLQNVIIFTLSSVFNSCKLVGDKKVTYFLVRVKHLVT